MPKYFTVLCHGVVWDATSIFHFMTLVILMDHFMMLGILMVDFKTVNHFNYSFIGSSLRHYNGRAVPQNKYIYYATVSASKMDRYI